jgi:uridine kinase
MTQVKIVGLAGRSCSGKSTIAKMLEANYSHKIVRICQDRFFKKYADDWESPSALNNYNLIYSLRKLKNGQSTHIPSAGWTEVYDRLVDPKPITLVEGYLLFENREIVDLCDVKIYVDVSDVNILYRRTKRDGTSAYIDYTMFNVIDTSHKYMKKQKQVAEVIIDGNKSKEDGYNDVVKYLMYKGLL